MQIIKILIPKIGLFPLDYKIAKETNLLIGDLVLVSVRNKLITGIVWELNCPITDKKLKTIDINSNPDNKNFTNINLLNIELIKKAADYYLSPLGSIAKLVLPVDINEKPLVTQLQEIPLNHSLPELSFDQHTALNNIKQIVKPILLKGVTSSGKTEIYFYLIAEALKEGKQALLMLPEISLTTQIIRRFVERFGFKPAIWNSTITKAQKKKILRGILNGDIKIVIGARSSLFLPYQNLALIIVDEEHDSSYKQAEGVMYNARDMAVLKAHLLNAQIILVSATPSLETIYNVQLGKYETVELKARFSGASLPKVEIIDMRVSNLEKNTWLSKPLIQAIATTIAEGNQCLLFLNRRGYAPLMLCKSCGYRAQCSKCSASMVVHKAKKKMACHHCGSENKIYDICPECNQSDSLILCGPGVERIEEEVKRIFPNLRVKIISRDQATKPKEVQELLQLMENGEIDILIGTQIITKGYHFPKLSLIGVIDADLGFMGGDLRAAEKTFQLLHQVGGRAGRENRIKGTVLLQSYFPENKVLTALTNGDEEEFIKRELLSRKEAGMPPFTRMAAINITGKSSIQACSIARYIAQRAPTSAARILGPAESLMFKLANKYRYRILIIAEKNFNIQKYLTTWLNNCIIPPSIQIKLDIDPYNFY